MPETKQTLPRSVGERWGLGLVSLFFGSIFGASALAVFTAREPGMGAMGTWIFIATEELLLAATVVAALLVEQLILKTESTSFPLRLHAFPRPSKNL